MSNHTSQTYVNNQSICATNYCLINGVIIPWRHPFGGFLYYAYSRLKNFGRYNPKTCSFSITQRRRNMFSVIRNLFIQGNMCESKKRNYIINSIINFSCKFSFLYNFIGKNIIFANLIKLWHKTSTNTDLKYSWDSKLKTDIQIRAMSQINAKRKR